jgi:hypothetical protein
MEQFAAQRFYNIAMLLEAPQSRLAELAKQDRNSELDERQCGTLVHDLELIERECLLLSLEASADEIQELRTYIAHSSAYKTAFAAEQLGHLSGSIRREMKRTLFLYIPPDRARWYKNPVKDWEEAISRFGSKITLDIEEASRSFACDRYAAAVFHVMRVAEFGALAVGELLGHKDPKPSWHSVIGEMTRIVQKTKFPDLKPLEQNTSAS